VSLDEFAQNLSKIQNSISSDQVVQQGIRTYPKPPKPNGPSGKKQLTIVSRDGSLCTARRW
jgi:hypothetical protein